jgi:hypothetical protein
MLELKFMQKPIIQTIVLALAVLFVLDMGYRLFLEESYYLQTTQGGKVYRINKKTGEVYVIGLDKMKRVEDVTPKKEDYSKYSLGEKSFDPYKYGDPIDGKKVSYYIIWPITSIVIGVFACINTLVWIAIQKRKKRDSSLH